MVVTRHLQLVAPVLADIPLPVDSPPRTVIPAKGQVLATFYRKKGALLAARPSVDILLAVDSPLMDTRPRNQQPLSRLPELEVLRTTKAAQTVTRPRLALQLLLPVEQDSIHCRRALLDPLDPASFRPLSGKVRHSTQLTAFISSCKLGSFHCFASIQDFPIDLLESVS